MEPGDIFQYVDLLDTSTSLEQVGVSENRHLAKGLVEACKHANLQTCKLANLQSQNSGISGLADKILQQLGAGRSYLWIIKFFFSFTKKIDKAVF